MIEKSEAANEFAAQKIWTDELAAYTAKVNTLIGTKVWAPIRAKADVPFGNSDYAKALEELSKFEDVYKYFRNDDKVERTDAGREYQEYLKKIDDRRNDEYLSSKMQASQAFKDVKQRDETYKHLDLALLSANAEQ